MAIFDEMNTIEPPSVISGAPDQRNAEVRSEITHDESGEGREILFDQRAGTSAGDGADHDVQPLLHVVRRLRRLPHGVLVLRIAFL